MRKLPKKASKAEVYIGVIIAVGIFLILSQTIATLVFSVYDLVIFNRTRTTARFLAEEKVEIAKNISFGQLGTQGGIPAGVLQQSETVVANGLNYTVATRVDNIDDPYDGTGENDSEPVDYKRVEVTVSWGGVGTSTVNSVKLSTIISPQTDIEVGGGTLDITVTNSVGVPISGAEVRVIASSLDPPVDTTLTTDSDGKVVIPGAAVCSVCYEISATYPGYSTDRTYGTDEVTNPSKPDVTVVEDQTSIVNFTIDELGELNIASFGNRESGFPTATNISFILRGTKIIGTDSSGTIIYKYAEIQNTGTSGNITVSDLEWDSYHIVIPTGTGLDVTGTNPLLPIVLNPGETKNVEISTDTGSDHRLHTEFVDNGNNPIASVAATLVENSTGEEATQSSGLETDPDFGQVFWGDLENDIYTLYATVSGFLEYSTQIFIDDYTRERAILIAE